MAYDLMTPPTAIEVADLVSFASTFGRDAAITARRLAFQQGRLEALVVKAVTLAMHGCYSNGVMNPAGTIDEGDVMAVRCLAELEKEAAALGIVLPGKAEPPDKGKAAKP